MKNVKATLLIVLSIVVIIESAALSTPEIHSQGLNIPTYTFAAAGDIGNLGGATGQPVGVLIDALNQSRPQFFMTLGDLSYDGGERSWCNEWLTGAGNPSGKSFKNIQLTTGNHDSGESPTGNINQFIDYCGLGALANGGFTSSPNRTTTSSLMAECNWPNSVVQCYGKEYFFDWPITNPIARLVNVAPQVRFNATIDSGGRWRYDYAGLGSHYDWVANAITSARTSGISWVIVVDHKNFITEDRDHGNEVGSEFFNLLVSNKVDLILQGHSHNYERTAQLTNKVAGCPVVNLTYNPNCVAATGDKFYKGDGSVLAIVGSGGRPFSRVSSTRYDGMPNPYQYFQTGNDTTWGYLSLSFSRLRMDASFVKTGGAGSFTDSFSILADDDLAFRFDWADVNADGNITIVDLVSLTSRFGSSCVSWLSTPDPCYWSIDRPAGETARVDIVGLLTVVSFFGVNTPRGAPFMGQGQVGRLDEYWRSRCDTLNQQYSSYCTFYFQNN